MERVSSGQNPTVKLIRSLHEKKYRQESGLFLAEGRKVLERARGKGWAAEYLVLRDGELPKGLDGLRILIVSDRVMASLSNQANPPDVIGVFRQRMAEDMPVPMRSDVWVGLDTIRDPGNLGTIIRTADAVGAAGVILIGQACDPWSPECVRATMGSIFAMPLVKMSEEGFAQAAASWPGEIVATRMAAGEDYRRSYRRPVLLLMGSEGPGLAPALARLAGTSVRIPMPGGAESLNVAIATALMLYEIRKADLA
jgi:TrmH family RNA methyltransferase